MAKSDKKPSKGSIYANKGNGNYYFRYQIDKQRKSVSLGTKNKKEALKKAEELIPILFSSTQEIVAAHMQHVKSQKQNWERLEIGKIWDVYEKHPERARPKSQKIFNVYKAYLKEFTDWLKQTHPDIEYMDEIRDTDESGRKLDKSIVSEYAEHLRSKKISVDTHRKKISRVARIFRTLDKYLKAPSPWENKKLLRSTKEESVITERRKPFPPDKERMMFEALRQGSPLKLLNKPEIEVLCHLLKYTGQRQKDCVLLSWNNVSMERRRIWVTQEKTGKKVSIPMAEELYVMLEKALQWKNNDKVLPKCAERYMRKAKDGTDTGVNLINKQILNVIKHVKLEPSVDVTGRKKKLTVYGVHSFRHGFASHCAEHGVPRAVCASILGANTSIIDSYYVHIGESAQAQAIEAVSGTNGGETPAHRLQEALAFIDELPDKKKSDTIMELKGILAGGSK